MEKAKTKALIMGAAGRDFHNFNVVFRGDPTCEVVAFTAAQMPNIDGTFAAYPHVRDVLPAMGYSDRQVHDLEETLGRVDCDLVIIATPVDLRRIVSISQPACRVGYELKELGKPDIEDILRGFLAERGFKP